MEKFIAEHVLENEHDYVWREEKIFAANLLSYILNEHQIKWRYRSATSLSWSQTTSENCRTCNHATQRVSTNSSGPIKELSGKSITTNHYSRNQWDSSSQRRPMEHRSSASGVASRDHWTPRIQGNDLQHQPNHSASQLPENSCNNYLHQPEHYALQISRDTSTSVLHHAYRSYPQSSRASSQSILCQPQQCASQSHRISSGSTLHRPVRSCPRLPGDSFNSILHQSNPYAPEIPRGHSLSICDYPTLQCPSCAVSFRNSKYPFTRSIGVTVMYQLIAAKARLQTLLSFVCSGGSVNLRLVLFVADNMFFRPYRCLQQIMAFCTFFSYVSVFCVRRGLLHLLDDFVVIIACTLSGTIREEFRAIGEWKALTTFAERNNERWKIASAA